LLGIGSCLAGNAVRYDGAANPANEHVRAVCEHFATQAFCPEVAIGLGVPRLPIHLVGSSQAVRVLDVHTHSHDYTQPLQAYALEVLQQAPLMCGYILVKGSPSCGYRRVKRFSPEGGYLASDQQGMFAATLAASDPLLPLEDDDGLTDPGRRESFVSRALAYHEWKVLLERGLTAHRLVAFYSRYKYVVMAHHVPAYQTLGPMLANAGRQDIAALAREFIRTLMTALSLPATRRSHSNVLFHLAGYLRKRSSAQQRQHLHTLIEDYRTGKVPLRVPLAQLQQSFAEYDDAYIHWQAYLNPEPRQA
jgi:uncharacterized protein YbgA (DUF1722 family)/uncharacterized protein YbbK (DUF523 family)